ncbi:MAG: deoxyribodipyrimidine photo-lyase [Candidatus Methanomethylicaceae archaeon]
MKVLYWFRRDLRTKDNRALAEAISKADKIVAVFVIDSEVLGYLKMSHYDSRFKFLLNALRNLDKRIRLHVFYGKTYEIFNYLLGKYKFDAIYTTNSLSWIEDSKIQEVKELCQRNSVKFIEIIDNILVNPFSIGSSIINFTTFYRRWRKLVDAKTIGELSFDNFIEIDEPNLEELCKKYGWSFSEDLLWKVDWYNYRLQSFDFGKYAITKDYPHLDGTSKLSPYISLGIVSIRDLFNKAVDVSEEFIRQLAWREFYYYLKYKHPYMKYLELKPHRRNIAWNYDKSLINIFKEGKTGYPIVDAGIRQLKMEKWMHNRVRLIVANFLVKDLLIDWRIGEEFFRENLIDYDEVLNIGNWQWSASVGVDPLFVRIFNPMKQAEKYDPLCQYIKKYIPELRDYKCRELHNPIKYRIREYYEPIVDHYEQIKKFREMISSDRIKHTYH